ncbi:hypothetical protein, partial [Streptomyces sp. NPDC058583]|uniref:hypothetical protein n=1 Tax=unclassified Streptomyces TaxID=2593676 RepID=UPI003649185E
QWRGLATRYDKTATTYLAGLHIAAIFIWSARWSEGNGLVPAALGAGVVGNPCPGLLRGHSGEGGGNELRATAERVLDFADYEATRRIFVGLYKKLAFAGLVTAVGVCTYAWTVSRTSASVQITTPRPVVLKLAARKHGG